MNKLVKCILCISAQISLAFITLVCFGIEIYLLIKNPVANRAVLSLFVGSCWFLDTISLLKNIDKINEIAKEFNFDFAYLIHRVKDLEKLSVKDLEKY